MLVPGTVARSTRRQARPSRSCWAARSSCSTTQRSPMAATNKCLARSNKTRHVIRATKDTNGHPTVGTAEAPRAVCSNGRTALMSQPTTKKVNQSMRTMIKLLATAATLAALATVAQADIACDARGCRETGRRLISGDGGGVTYHQCVTSYRNGTPQKVCFRAGPDGYKR